MAGSAVSGEVGPFHGSRRGTRDASDRQPSSLHIDSPQSPLLVRKEGCLLLPPYSTPTSEFEQNTLCEAESWTQRYAGLLPPTQGFTEGRKRPLQQMGPAHSVRRTMFGKNGGYRSEDLYQSKTSRNREVSCDPRPREIRFHARAKKKRNHPGDRARSGGRSPRWWLERLCTGVEKQRRTFQHA